MIQGLANVNPTLAAAIRATVDKNIDPTEESGNDCEEGENAMYEEMDGKTWTISFQKFIAIFEGIDLGDTLGCVAKAMYALETK